MAKSRTPHSEDDLGFDPFQETQKALAELIANEQNYKTHNNVRGGMQTGQMNGVVHSQGSKNHLPPPPPGFVQPTTHMNSFGK
jgi:CCR4-NOT transcription complex subunit 4